MVPRADRAGKPASSAIIDQNGYEQGYKGVSLLIVTISNIVTGNVDYLMIAFSILYGIISFRFRYWGEMITYLGMSMPMAIWSVDFLLQRHVWIPELEEKRTGAVL